MLNETLPLILFPMMLMVSGYLLSDKETPKLKIRESIYGTILVWHVALLIMVVHHIVTINFVVFYPLILAIYIHMMMSDRVTNKRVKVIVGAVVTLVAFLNTIISEEWVIAISIAIVYLVIIIFESNDRVQKLY